MWPKQWDNQQQSPNFLNSVDGIHCLANETIHPTLAKNTKLNSYNFHQAGFSYELALLLTENLLASIHGPFVGSKHDITIFCEAGLKDKTTIAKKGIADKGYCGEKITLHTKFIRFRIITKIQGK